MKKFFNKAKAALDNNDTHASSHTQIVEGPSTIQPPTLADVTRYRYHHGTNLGSTFVQERWLTGCMHDESFPGSSELTAVEGWVKSEGIDKARERFERHWREYTTDADLDWLRDVAKCNAIRLPIGYFTLGAAYCENTPFQAVGAVYQHSWQAVKDLIQRCGSRGISVLIDLHALPGGANGGDHSGTNSGKAGFWHSRKSKSLATRCLCFIAQQVRDVPTVSGIQIVNESEYDANGMYEWYSDVLKELSTIDCTMPIYVSDGWDLTRCAGWTRQKNTMAHKHANPVVIDTHLYWCFDDADQHKSPQQIAAEVGGKLHENELKDGSVADRGASQAVVGEYSCVLGDASWARGGGDPKDQLVRNFGNAESQRYQQRAGGSYFWTYKMDWMPGGEWGFKQMTEQHAIIPPASLTLEIHDLQQRISQAQSQRDHLRGSSWGSHCQYWDSSHPGEYEHDRFVQGWDVGFSDAMVFFGMRSQHDFSGADKIGMLDMWVLKRLRESGQAGKFVWEYEQGLRQGIRDFYQAAGV